MKRLAKNLSVLLFMPILLSCIGGQLTKKKNINWNELTSFKIYDYKSFPEGKSINPDIQIKDLSKDLGYSERWIQKKFRNIIGSSNQARYYDTINLGVNYYELNYDRCLEFLEMLPNCLK